MIWRRCFPYMIVNSEEPFIGKCFDSVKHILDKIMIVDNRVDNLNIYMQVLRPKVFEIPWKENFANEGNYSLRQVTGDWILWMDVDEELDQGAFGARS
ncbi:glycosyltransferase [Lysinibacillus sp. Bpr_S20]|uniref:glycosyltransferase n=1 Tax=Lysinibacillus sp. Bpr_S20 TaxID=2933964 RepID=UPI002012629E|nr:glycosyltransferase [Lysinibacillus sp. Bpr_S20]MCL1702448.1 glycosyltransferase [Lysinibacillus sp. Bpr_S20]